MPTVQQSEWHLDWETVVCPHNGEQFTMPSGKTVAIHQPNYIPWIGYFCKILKADTFVFLDNVQFSRGGYANRNKINAPNGPIWLTQPVPHKKGTYQVTDEVEFSDSTWKQVHLNLISRYYRRAGAYDRFFERLKDAYLKNESCKLVDFNIALIQQITTWLGLATKFVRASELGVRGRPPWLNPSICQAVGASTYLSGMGGKHYQDESAFEALGIELVYSDFQHPTYPQLSSEFTPNLSIIDLLLNCGDESAQILGSNQ